MFFLLEFYQLFYLVVVFLLHLQQHLAHFGDEHPVHLVFQGLVVGLKAALDVDSVSHLLTLSLNEGLIVFADCLLIFLS